MKRILALTLALMLALSLTSALAEDQRARKVPLFVNVNVVNGSPIYTNDDSEQNVWDIAYSTSMLIWNMENTVSPQKSRTWNTKTHSYDVEDLDSSSIDSVVKDPQKSITVTNNCNFELGYSVEFGDVDFVSIVGSDNSGTIPSGGERTISLTLDVSKLPDKMKQENAEGQWSMGDLKILYTAGERVQPQSDDPDEPGPDDGGDPDLP